MKLCIKAVRSGAGFFRFSWGLFGVFNDEVDFFGLSEGDGWETCDELFDGGIIVSFPEMEGNGL
jgi:hypothetical protein